MAHLKNNIMSGRTSYIIRRYMYDYKIKYICLHNALE